MSVLLLYSAVSSARADSKLPLGKYAANSEICKLDDKDYDPMSDFRARFGSDAIADVDDTSISFAAIPANCDIAQAKEVKPGVIQVKAACNVFNNDEDIVFEVTVKPNALAFATLKGPSDGFFSRKFKKTYVLCSK